MKRRAARELAFQLTYEMVMTGDYNPDTADDLLSGADEESRDYIMSVVRGIKENRDVIKTAIIKFARGYDYDRIYKTDLALLFLACYELMYTDTPKAVVCNEAVEIAKAYSDTQSYSFINGILASVIKDVSNE